MWVFRRCSGLSVDLKTESEFTVNLVKLFTIIFVVLFMYIQFGDTNLVKPKFMFNHDCNIMKDIDGIGGDRIWKH